VQCQRISKKFGAIGRCCLWVPNWSSTSGDLVIFVDQSAEPVVTSDAKVGLGRGRWGWPKWCCVLQGAVGAVLVEMRRVLGQDVFEVAPVGDQYSVEQLAVDGGDPSFGDRVRLGARTGVRRMRMPSLATTASKASVNWLWRSRINKPEPSDTVAEVYQLITGLLSDPRSAGMCRDPQGEGPGGWHAPR